MANPEDMPEESPKTSEGDITQEEAARRLEAANRERQQRQELLTGGTGGRTGNSTNEIDKLRAQLAAGEARQAELLERVTVAEARAAELEIRQVEAEAALQRLQDLSQQLYEARQRGGAPEQLQQMMLNQLGGGAPAGRRAERLGFPVIPERHELEWLRTHLAVLERTSSAIPELNISQIIQAITLLEDRELQKKLLDELFARYALHNGTLALSRVNLEGYIGMMGSQPVEFLETVSKVEQVSEAIDLFEGGLTADELVELAPNLKQDEPKLTQVFSTTALHQDEKVYDNQGNELYTITRKDKIRSGFYDFRFLKNLFKAELLLKLINEDTEVREDEEDLSSIKNPLIQGVKDNFKETDRCVDETGERQIGDVFEGLFNLSDKQKTKLARLRTQVQTAVNLVEKIYRVTGIASTCDVPKYYKRDIPELGAKKDRVVIPFAKGFRRGVGGKVEQVLMETGKRVGADGRDELFDFAGNLVVAATGGEDKEEEVAAQAVREGRSIYRVVLTEDDERINAAAIQSGNITPNSRLIQRGSGDYAMWRDMWTAAYAERLQRGREELRPNVTTGMVSFSLFKVLPGNATSKENAHTQVLARNARGETVMSGAKLEEAGLKKLLENIRTGNWSTADWGDWLGNLKQADDNRAMLEARDGYLYRPSIPQLIKIATSAYQNFKDKEFDRQTALTDLYIGAIKFNTHKEVVEKYYGDGAPTWTHFEVEDLLRGALRRGELNPRKLEEVKNDPDVKPGILKIILEILKEIIVPAALEGLSQGTKESGKQLQGAALGK